MNQRSQSSRGSGARLLRRGLMLAALGLVAAPVAAFAGTASVNGTTLSYVAAAGERNNVTIAFNGVTNVYTIDDAGTVGTPPAPVAVTPGAGCINPIVGDTTFAECTLVGATLVSVDLGDSDDTFDALGLATATTVVGGAGDDDVRTGSGNDVVTLGDGRDAASTGAGNDSIDGGAGDDDVSFDLTGGPGNDAIVGGTGDDQLIGGDGDDALDGGAGDDRISDGVGTDTVVAGSGDDAVTAGTGTDSMSGGPDTDRITYSRVAPVPPAVVNVAVTLDGIANDGEVGEADNAQADFENITSNGDGNDTLIGNAAVNDIVGGSGDDTISGLGNDDSLFGGDGNDTVSGGTGQDSVNGGDGNDTLSGNEGNDDLGTDRGSDSLSGGTGRDFASYGGETSSVTVSLDDVANDGRAAEADNVRSDIEDVATGSGDDTLSGNSAINDLSGGAGNDTINGLSGDDSLFGGSGNDTLDGGVGDDDVDGGLDTDTIGGGAGNDTVSYANRIEPVTVILNGLAGDGAAGENDTIKNDVENVIGGSAADRLTGSKVANELSGGGGNDTINGQAGSDELFGGRGADKLTGGKGNDTVNGGGGPDQIFVKDSASDDVFCGAGNDIIRVADRTGARRDRTSPDCERGGVRP